MVSKSVKANWFHWQIYKIFRYFWNPIFAANPSYRAAMITSFQFYEGDRANLMRNMDCYGNIIESKRNYEMKDVS